MSRRFALLFALIAATTAAQTVSPPPPPPPLPLIPLESGSPLCTREALINFTLPAETRPVFAAFGGSNTQGANVLSLNPNGGTHYGGHLASFAKFLQKALQGFTTQMNADGGSGPSVCHAGLEPQTSRAQSATHTFGPCLGQLVGACANRFIPPETRFGTIEFLPNIGYIKEDRAELAAVKLMLQAMNARGAPAYLVNILSGSARFVRDARFGFCGRFQNATERDASVIGCMSRERVVYLHTELSKIAKAQQAHVITRDADETPELFGADSFHLNANGHRSVFNEIWSIHRNEPCKQQRARAARSVGEAGMGILCALGDGLEPLVQDAKGFASVNLAAAGKAPKIGWSTVDPGSSLTLCTSLPREDKEAKMQDMKTRIMPHPKDRITRPLAAVPYRISLGFQVSHPRNRPLFGVARVDCYGSCNCSCAQSSPSSPGDAAAGCSIDTLQNTSMVTITTYLKLEASEQAFQLPPDTPSSCPADSCIIRVRNAAAAEAGEAEGRFRVVMRALILGLNDWRTTMLPLGGVLKDVRRQRRA